MRWVRSLFFGSIFHCIVWLWLWHECYIKVNIEFYKLLFDPYIVANKSLRCSLIPNLINFLIIVFLLSLPFLFFFPPKTQNFNFHHLIINGSPLCMIVTQWCQNIYSCKICKNKKSEFYTGVSCCTIISKYSLPNHN